MSFSQFETNLANELASFQGSNKLLESVKYSLLSPGKRIRPQMVYASAKAVSLDMKVATHLAIALEMIHCFTLIHDDLPCMDNDDFRRGIPTNHKKFGEATALLAGDALISMAYETLTKASDLISPSAFKNALTYFSQMIGPSGVIGGQANEAELMVHPSYEKLIHVFELKTGALFSASLALPAILKDSPEPLVQKLKRTGTEYGVVFQIVDDLEDPHQKNSTSILNYLSFDAAFKDAQSRLNSVDSNVKASIAPIHELFEKKLQACLK